MGGKSPLCVNWLVHRINRQEIEAAARGHARGMLLDIGCGHGRYNDLLDRCADSRTGMELDRGRYVSVCRPGVWGSGLSLPFRDDCFDTVVSFQVLEHVPEPAQMVQEIARVLKPGGCLILTAPHIWGIHEEPEDYFRFTGFGLSHLSRVAGLKVVSVRSMAGYWVTAGARFCYYLQLFERLPGMALLLRPLYALVQLAALVLDRLHRVEGDAWNFILVATKPRTQAKQEEPR
jgi:SAM-dependent methyltransferase|tara:strand:+ start:394 stop:1092 length:699 start_codon:yes stop_codon:yes gene_type:complete